MKTIIRLAFLLSTVSAFAQSHFYTTTFPATESPICQNAGSGCVWVNGLATGLSWADVKTTTNKAIGTQAGTGAPPFNDSTAVLTGTWSADQIGSATVFMNNPTDVGNEEVEIRLRSTVTANKSTGYEFQWGGNKTTPANCYVDIVAWLGAVNSFASMAQHQGSQYCLHTGDVVKATAIGSTLTQYINGTQINRVTDTRFSSGNPGIGFYQEFTSNTDFGFSAYTVQDSSYIPGPSPPTNLTYRVVPQ